MHYEQKLKEQIEKLEQYQEMCLENTLLDDKFVDISKCIIKLAKKLDEAELSYSSDAQKTKTE